jgi:hypothetical protein
VGKDNYIGKLKVAWSVAGDFRRRLMIIWLSIPAFGHVTGFRELPAEGGRALLRHGLLPVFPKPNQRPRMGPNIRSSAKLLTCF